MTNAMRKTFENHGHTFTVEQFYQVMTFDNNENMQKKWRAFCCKIDTKTDDYSTVLQTIKVFLTKPFTTAIDGSCFNEQRIAADNTWCQEKEIRWIYMLVFIVKKSCSTVRRRDKITRKCFLIL